MHLFRQNLILISLLLLLGFIFYFPDLSHFPGPGCDTSWIWSLQYAITHHFQWGPDYVFTYGPLGFLNFCTVFESKSAWALACFVQISSILLILGFLVGSSLRSRNSPLNTVSEIALCFILIGGIIEISDPQLDIFFVSYGLLALSIKRGLSISRLLGVSLLLTLSALIKATALIGSIALILALFIASFLLNSHEKFREAWKLALYYFILNIMAWPLAGQSLTHLPAYIYAVFQMVAGYNAMAVNGSRPEIALALIYIVFYLIAVLITLIKRGKDRSYALALFFLSAPVLFLYWKEGFTRHDGHSAIFFSIFPFVLYVNYLVAKEISSIGRDLFLLGSIVSLFFLYVEYPGWFPAYNPSQSFTRAQSALDTFSKFKSISAHIQETLRNGYSVPDEVIASLRPVPTVIIPYELLIAPAYNIPIAMPPMPQLYSAYTPYLDNLDADWLNKEQPKEVLYEFAAIDNRYPLFESPLMKLHRSARVLSNATGRPLFCDAPQ